MSWTGAGSLGEEAVHTRRRWALRNSEGKTVVLISLLLASVSVMHGLKHADKTAMTNLAYTCLYALGLMMIQ